MTPDTRANRSPAPAQEPVPAPYTRSHRGRVRWSLRRVPVLVWAVTALHIALMAMCTLLYPTFTGLDETTHVDMAYAYSKGHGLYAPGDRLLARGVEVAYGDLTIPPKEPYADSPIRPRGERPSFDAAGGDAPPQGYLVPNQMVQHPPLYYLVEAGVLRVPGVGDLPYDRQVALLRWVSVLMLAPLPLLIWATGRRLLGPDSRAPALAAVIPATMPGLSRLGGSVNNDNLLILLAALLTFILSGVLRGDLRRRTGALVGLLLGLALLTKGLALVFPLFIVGVYAVAWARYRRPTLVPLALAAVVSAAVGGWWWVRNVVLFGTVQPSGLGAVWDRRIDGPARPGFTWSELVPKFAERLSMRYWSGLGYPDAPILPKVVTGVWLAGFVAVALVGVAVGIGGRKGRLAAATLLLPSLGLVGLIFYGTGVSYVFNGRLPGIQGRYVYSGLISLAVLFALGLTRLAGRAARVLPLLVLGAGLLTQAWAWRLLVSAWWVPRDTAGDRVAMARGAIDAVERWSPWPEWMTALPFLAVPLLALAALAVAVATALRRPRPEPTEAGPGAVGDRPGPVGNRPGPVGNGPEPAGAVGGGAVGGGLPAPGAALGTGNPGDAGRISAVGHAGHPEDVPTVPARTRSSPGG